MNRATWRDVVVDVCTISILFGAVLLKLWAMSSAAPWMVAVAAGRWGASTISRYAAAKAGVASALPKSVPPPAGMGAAPPVTIAAPLAMRTPVGADYPEVEGQDDEPAPLSKPLPTSGIVLIAFAIGAAVLHALSSHRGA